MSLPRLQEYFTPEDGPALVEMLKRYGDNALIVGGGTFVHGLSARGLLSEVEALIDIGRLGLNYVKASSKGLVLGAGATFTQLQSEATLEGDPHYGAIRDALEYPPVQIKNTATIGGSVAASCPFFDLPVSLLALAATVGVQGPGGERELPLDQFFTGLFETALESGEFIRELRVSAGKGASAFIKLESNANDLAILNTAVYLSVDKAGQCSEARVFVSGGVGETPVRATSAEEALRGKALDEKSWGQAGAAAQTDIEPMTDHRASAAYRKALTRVLVERALKRAAGRLGSGGKR